MDYSKILASLNKRYNPESIPAVETRMMSESAIYDKGVSKYVFAAMREVDPEYTQKTKAAGAAVKILLSRIIPNIDFAYQGSVMTDTHIKGASDIDMLVLCTKFENTEIDKIRCALQEGPVVYNPIEWANLQSFNDNFSQYQGNSLADLMNLRLACEELLQKQYCYVDITKPKSIKLTNQHYHRDVDVVVASKHMSKEYVLKGGKKEYLGIRIFNKEQSIEEAPDYPFLSIFRINQRSAETDGRFKRMIRFLKNVNVDIGIKDPLKSFDINAICYSIPKEDYENCSYQKLVYVVWRVMYNMLNTGSYDQLKSVVGDEWVFYGKPEKVNALRQLENEVWNIYCDLNPNINLYL